MTPDFDVLIIGGGMVGASLAAALGQLPLRVGVVEAVDAQSAEQPSFDARAIALSQGSKRIFQGLDLWDDIQERGATAITRIHVSDRGHFGRTRLSAEQERVEALGYVVEAGVLGAVLLPSLRGLPNAERICPARIKTLAFDPDRVTATLDCAGAERVVSTRLLVAADGGRSSVREILGGRMTRLGYGQTAVIAHVVTDREHGGVAYERFTDTGPLALLPCRGSRGTPDERYGDRRWSLVWTAREAEVEGIVALDDDAFLARLQERFGTRAGRFEAVDGRHAYPLGLQYVRDYVRERVVFIGNAAHSLHPVGGQGFNLGLRDVAALAEVIAGAAADNADPGAPEVLEQYRRWRRPDYAKLLGLTDGLVRIFSSHLMPVAGARNLGLLGLELAPPAKHIFARQMMGLTGRLPRLARGLPLAG